MKSLLLVFALVCVLGSISVADDKPPYKVDVKARQVRAAEPADRKDVITVETKIIDNAKEGAVLSAPRLSMFDGSQAQIVVGDQAVAPQRLPAEGTVVPKVAAAGKDPDAMAIASGLKVDVIKPLGNPQVLVVTTILKEGKVIWADAQWSMVEPAKP